MAEDDDGFSQDTKERIKGKEGSSKQYGVGSRQEGWNHGMGGEEVNGGKETTN